MIHRFFALCLGLALIASGATAATMDSQLQGNLGVLGLSAEATFDGALWQYTYTLTCSSIGNRAAHVFAVDNPLAAVYTGAANSAGFVNPDFSTSITPEWRDVAGGLLQGQTAVFTFESVYAPSETPVFAMVVNAGTAAWGETIGMSNSTPSPTPVVPEAGALSLATAGMAGLMGVRCRLLRRLRARGGGE